MSNCILGTSRPLPLIGGRLAARSELLTLAPLPQTVLIKHSSMATALMTVVEVMRASALTHERIHSHTSSLTSCTPRTTDLFLRG